MKLITAADRERLLANALRKISDPDFDPRPVVKLYIPFRAAIWLLTEIDPNDPNTAFGLCDLGLGSPELGYIYLPELDALRVGPTCLVKRDFRFQATKRLSVYADEARREGRILA